MSFTGPASMSPFKLDIWACILGLCAYSLNPISYHLSALSNNYHLQLSVEPNMHTNSFYTKDFLLCLAIGKFDGNARERK